MDQRLELDDKRVCERSRPLISNRAAKDGGMKGVGEGRTYTFLCFTLQNGSGSDAGLSGFNLICRSEGRECEEHRGDSFEGWELHSVDVLVWCLMRILAGVSEAILCLGLGPLPSLDVYFDLIRAGYVLLLYFDAALSC